MNWTDPSEKGTADAPACRAMAASKNLGVHGLEGDCRRGGQVDSYYDDTHAATAAFAFVPGSPPFNVRVVDKERLQNSAGPKHRKNLLASPRECVPVSMNSCLG
jgi:hypothetical protein